MGKRSMEHQRLRRPKSQTLPPSPSHSFSSSSSSDFEFTISVSPRKSSHALCPADELFYKGQLLPLQLSPRLSMVRTLLASSSTSSSSDATTTASRDSTGSSNDSHSSFNSELVLLAESCDSSGRASSVNEEEELRRLNPTSQSGQIHFGHQIKAPKGSNKYFSLARFSSVFKKEPKLSHRSTDNCTGADTDQLSAPPPPSSSVRRMSATAKEVVRKYLKKVKPLYEKISQKQQQQTQKTAPTTTTTTTNSMSFFSTKGEGSVKGPKKEVNGGRGGFSNSFSGNLRYPRRKSSISSCPSSIRSSPNHSAVLCRPGFGGGRGIYHNNNHSFDNTTLSSMDELQSAIQGAIAHCKNSLLAQNNNKTTVVSNEV